MEPLQQHLNSLLREEQVELALICATSILGIRGGFTPDQQSRFNTPWVKAPESEEEQFHQDLVWVYKVLPPNDKFNPYLAEKGHYTRLKHQVLDEFWSNYDPEQKTQRHIPKIFKPRPLTKPKTLKAIRRHLAEENRV